MVYSLTILKAFIDILQTTHLFLSLLAHNRNYIRTLVVFLEFCRARWGLEQSLPFYPHDPSLVNYFIDISCPLLCRPLFPYHQIYSALIHPENSQLMDLYTDPFWGANSADQNFPLRIFFNLKWPYSIMIKS